jgi:O-antigen ligase
VVPYHSLVGFDGQFTMSFIGILQLFFFGWCVRTVFTTAAQYRQALQALIMGLGIATVYAGIQQFVMLPSISTTFFTSLMVLVSTLAIVAFLGALIFERRSAKIGAQIVSVASVIGVMYLDHTFGLLLLVLFSFFFFLNIARQGSVFSQKFMYGVSAMCVIASLWLLLPVGSVVGVSQVIDLVLPSQFSWDITFDAVRTHPFFGYGLQNFTAPFHQFRPLAYNTTILWELTFQRAHATAAEVLATTGIFGFMGLYGFFVYVGYQSLKTLRTFQVIATLPSIKAYTLLSGLTALYASLVLLTGVLYFDQILLFLLTVCIGLLMGQEGVQRYVIIPQGVRMIVVVGLMTAVLIPVGFIGAGYRVLAYYQADQEVLPQALQEASQLVPYNIGIHSHAQSYVLAQATQESVFEKELSLELIRKAQNYAHATLRDTQILEGMMRAHMQVFGPHEFPLATLDAQLHRLDPYNPIYDFSEARTLISQLQLQQQVGSALGEEVDAYVGDVLSSALALKPQWRDIYFLQGDYHILFNRLDEAEQSYTKALVLDPRNKETVLALLKTLRATGKNQEADDLLNRYIQDNPTDEDLLDL